MFSYSFFSILFLVAVVSIIFPPLSTGTGQY